MSIKSFDELTVEISMKIKSTHTHMRLSIPPLEMLGVTLKYVHFENYLLIFYFKKDLLTE